MAAGMLLSKIYQGEAKREKLYYTRIACNLLDVETGKCRNYPERFKIEEVIARN